ncbi:DUF4226 domain-containing protein [Mycolicibacter senuensis]|uniref:DUF6973 domain-containing protein n=1 Tax=Mycolicibacter senuensis TaxID=386913 RepID=A0A7I9XNT2_9MYCO|nr:DUF4226 domain-containing protein [Mycolicibacter senuensis]ORW68397.1 hypothetical protein AWC24_07925 [Mycolicibacter senuensis]GFG71589.1 hypothetical protein MSEN_33090 [Mycolicibacter senuensis]
MPEVTGVFADAARAREDQLVQRLTTSVELDRSFEEILRDAHQFNVQSRQRLDALEAEIRQAAAAWPALNTPAGARQFQAYLSGKTREIHKIVADAAADSQRRAAQVQALTGRYPLRGDRTIRSADFPLHGPPPVDPLEQILKRYQVSEDPDGELDWEPPWPLSLATDPVHVTAGEARMLGDLSPFALRDLNQIKEAAATEAKVRFPPQNGPNDTADNHTDAFRHTYWNALMTQRFGENWTRDFATAHERLPNNPATAEAMDLYNNEVGREIAAANPRATPAQLADLVQQAVERGDTVVIAPGGDKLAWSNTVAWGEAGTTTNATVPGQAPTPTGAGPGGVYDPGQPGGYGTSAGGY